MQPYEFTNVTNIDHPYLKKILILEKYSHGMPDSNSVEIPTIYSINITATSQ